MAKSEALEHEAGRIRAELLGTINELRARLSPGHVIDQIVASGSDSTAVELVRNLRDKTVANPLAFGIVGAGIAWLMLSNRRVSRQRERPTPERAVTFSSDAAKSVGRRHPEPPPGMSEPPALGE
jgi:hypothetical protein